VPCHGFVSFLHAVVLSTGPTPQQVIMGFISVAECEVLRPEGLRNNALINLRHGDKETRGQGDFSLSPPLPLSLSPCRCACTATCSPASRR
jgi:hypothetical protein